MLNFELNAIQNTAVGYDQSGETKMYVYRMRCDDTVHVSADPNFGSGIIWPAYGYERVATYTIHRPCILVGDMAELTVDLCRMVLADLRERGLTTENDWGTVFWVGKPEDGTLYPTEARV